MEPALGLSWLEMPAVEGASYSDGVKIWSVTTSGYDRNYTIAYDTQKYATYWVAYPLNSGHMGSLSRPDDWTYDTTANAPATSTQVNLCSRSYTTYNNGAGHSKGHLIPNASRNGVKALQLQTFFVTNSVPQIHNNFNDGVWSSLEGALQSIAKKEEIYIVTGTSFAKVGENKTISYTKATDDTKQVPVPNYFYKVVLKVDKNSAGVVTSASTIGFWFENKAYTDKTYSNYTVSVDQIETWTGLDFFVNLPDSVENSAESNTSWNTFSSF